MNKGPYDHLHVTSNRSVPGLAYIIFRLCTNAKHNGRR